MKQVTEKQTTTVEQILWEAIDGTRFLTEEECRKYEKSAEGVLMAKYRPLIVREHTEYTLFSVGSEEIGIDVVKPRTMEDVDNVMQLVALKDPTLEPDTISSMYGKCKKAVQQDDCLFICWGYEGSTCFILSTLQEFMQNVVNNCKPET